MYLAPFKAIRPKPQHMHVWVNRQIDNYSQYLCGEIDFFPYPQLMNVIYFPQKAPISNQNLCSVCLSLIFFYND